MKLLAILFLVGFALCAHGFTLREKLKELLARSNADIDESDLSHHHHHHGKGHCVCSSHGCWCHGVDAGVKVHAVLSVDETRHCDCKKTVIDGTFFIGKEWFEEQFPVDQFEDFCKKVGGKEFCFAIDVQDTKSKTLRGCLRLTRPERVDMGCFGLPLMTSSEALASFQDQMDQDADLPAIGMEESTELDITLDRCRHRCWCCSHGCTCKGMDDGYKVVVILSVDECHHDGTKHAVIEGRFLIDKVSFIKQFHDSEDLDDFCHIAEGKRFCFDIDASRVCSGGIKGYIKLTKPKKVDLGCFNVPLLTSSSGSSSLDDDEATVDQTVMPYYDDDDDDDDDAAEGNENQIFIDEY
ncbi:uncharacterized protein LOC123539268 [Mercenaria mercenaria]|uniref:uncharacterized protein LOC123539268 n=1 Tax=Mercenaria mercenaria TaxID=6596 RepID=UPI00234F731D|nr:uncharacterized protein LOC123539268 [Mercenaria mercenaria]